MVSVGGASAPRLPPGMMIQGQSGLSGREGRRRAARENVGGKGMGAEGGLRGGEVQPVKVRMRGWD